MHRDCAFILLLRVLIDSKRSTKKTHWNTKPDWCNFVFHNIYGNNGMTSKNREVGSEGFLFSIKINKSRMFIN